MSPSYYISLAVMAGVTYLIRMLPLAVFRKKIENEFVSRFLYFVPFAALSAMTFPAIFSSTSGIVSACVGVVIAIVVSLFGKSLATVAVCACVGVFLTELII